MSPAHPVHQSPAAARTARAWPLLVVVAGVLTGLGIAVVGTDTWRLGALVVGVSLGIGSLERLLLPRNAAGLLAVRSKGFDTIVLLGAGVAVVALSIAVPSAR